MPDPVSEPVAGTPAPALIVPNAGIGPFRLGDRWDELWPYLAADARMEVRAGYQHISVGSLRLVFDADDVLTRIDLFEGSDAEFAGVAVGAPAELLHATFPDASRRSDGAGDTDASSTTTTTVQVSATSGGPDDDVTEWDIVPGLVAWTADQKLAAFSVVDDDDFRIGYIRTDGTFALAATSRHGRAFREGRTFVTDADEGRWRCVDTNGRAVGTLTFDEVRAFREGRAAVRIGTAWGYLSPAGDWVVPPRFARAGDMHEGLAAVTDDDSAGYIGPDGRWNLDAPSHVLGPFSEGLASCVDPATGLVGFLNRNGGWHVPPEFREVATFRAGRCAASDPERDATDNPTWGAIDETGEWAVAPEWDWVGGFDAGVAPVRLGGEVRFILADGRDAFDVTVDEIAGAGARQVWFEGLAAVRVGRLWGYLDPTGSFAIEPQYHAATGFSGGLAAAKDRGKWGFIDRSGRWRIEPKFDFAGDFTGGLAQVAVNRCFPQA